MAWRKKIPLADLIGDDDSFAAIITAGKGVRERLAGEKDAPLKYIDRAVKLAEEEDEIAVVVFNYGLAEVYAWADHERIWLGAA